jgi:hypothetical protein
MDEKSILNPNHGGTRAPKQAVHEGIADLKADPTSILIEDVDDEYRAVEKKLVRKLDLTLVPMLWVLYLFNYLDRNNIASVATCSLLLMCYIG